MKYLSLELAEIMSDIKKNNKKIIVFGAGVIASSILPYYLKKHNLESQVEFCIDNSISKHGKNLHLCSKDIPICSVSKLDEINYNNVVIIITSSVFESIINQLNKINNINEAEYCIFPIMLINENSANKIINTVFTDESIIPKRIHYIWLGENEMPELMKKCIASWREFCPDYEIICWNEKNYDFCKSEYMEYAYKKKKWAFVSDYARIDILNEYGGIYMDTDVELLKNLDSMCNQTAFCSVEKWNVVNTGGCCGTIKNGTAIKAMLDFRKYYDSACLCDFDEFTASGYYETMAMIQEGYEPNGKFQKILDMNIYPYDFFHPFDYVTGKTNITDNTFSIHYFNGGWVDKNILSQRYNFNTSFVDRSEA